MKKAKVIPFYPESCMECARPSRTSCYVYLGRRKICFICYGREQREKRALIEQMRDVPSLNLHFDLLHPYDAARVDRLWSEPLSYYQDQ